MVSPPAGRRKPASSRTAAVVASSAGTAAASVSAPRALAALDPDERRLLADLLHRATRRSSPGAERRLPV